MTQQGLRYVLYCACSTTLKLREGLQRYDDASMKISRFQVATFAIVISRNNWLQTDDDDLARIPLRPVVVVVVAEKVSK